MAKPGEVRLAVLLKTAAWWGWKWCWWERREYRSSGLRHRNTELKDSKVQQVTTVVRKKLIRAAFGTNVTSNPTGVMDDPQTPCNEVWIGLDDCLSWCVSSFANVYVRLFVPLLLFPLGLGKKRKQYKYLILLSCISCFFGICETIRKWSLPFIWIVSSSDLILYSFLFFSSLRASFSSVLPLKLRWWNDHVFTNPLITAWALPAILEN